MSRIGVEECPQRVRIEVDGVTVADSKRARVLRERGLPPRYYLPAEDVRTDLLTRTDSSTRCPYKGTASYWSLTVGGRIHTDLVWSYEDPIAERADIAGLLCFYDDQVDLYLDDERQ
ncbi:hypothetical protein GCM10009547_17750 [Sporichthya brevicatena]|uniref:DUF427 domain-containing protein n=1 Tax=Sporichthya brevicatena TaxID=171442 RepID=A0ABP3RXS0_9ACTN